MISTLITGGAGFIGSHLVDKLLEENFEVKVIDNFYSGRFENIERYINHHRFKLIRGDLKNKSDVEDAVKGVDVVFHFAANPEVRVSTTSPETHFRENLLATFNLLEAMRKYDVKELIFASSSSVYGEPLNIPVDENEPIKPVSVYGATKAACENLIHAYSSLYRIKAIILRYANVVGPRLRHGVVWDLLTKLKKDKLKLEVLGDGMQIRSYIYITDAIDATIIAWKRTDHIYDVYNVASEDWITVNDVVKIIVKILNLKDIEITYKPLQHGVGWLGDVKKIALKVNKIEKLGIKPKYTSIEAIRRTVKALSHELYVQQA
jgi:UDP-glucose 4-epimerase